jgi:PAS domain S-box-containing protein
MQDITAHVILEESVHLQAMVLDQIHECVIVSDLNGRTLYFNNAQSKAFECSVEDIYFQGTPIMEKKLEKSMTRSQVLEQTMLDGQWQGEVLRRISNGNEVVMECRMNVICDASGKHIAICETTSDITERIRTYEALHYEAQRRKILMQKSSDGIAIFDHDHRVIEANERFASMLGYSPQEMVDMHTWDFEAVFSKEQIFALPLTSMNNNVIETKHRRKDGSIYPVEVSVSSVSFLDGKFIFTISRDITAQKKAESDLISALRNVEKSDNAKSLFLENMSHELRTPLNGILGMLQILIKTSLDSNQNELVGIAIESVLRLNRLLNDIIEIARIEAGMWCIKYEHFVLSDVLYNVKMLYALSAKDKNIDLKFKVDKDVPTFLLGDQVRLQQILANLIGNAIKFTNKGCVILEISSLSPLREHQARLLFSISDTGIGMSEDRLESLFKPFSQIEDGYARNYQGPGLGLSICQRLINIMGGNISIISEIEKGTTIYFSLSFGIKDAA